MLPALAALALPVLGVVVCSTEPLALAWPTCFSILAEAAAALASQTI